MTDPTDGNPSSDIIFAAARDALANRADGEAIRLLQQAVMIDPRKSRNAVALSGLLVTAGREAEAIEVLENLLRAAPESPDAWLNLAVLRESAGLDSALPAYYQAMTRARKVGRWLDQSTTPQHLLPKVVRAAEQLRTRRKELFMGSFDAVRQKHGNQAVSRVEFAVASHLREVEVAPGSPQQQPRFLFFPGLNSEPFLDPCSQPWAGALLSGFEDIRREALEVTSKAQSLQKFIDLKSGDQEAKYLRKATRNSSWDAFFFYRRGARFEQNHASCPRTSDVLESIELCRIADQAPEICFSLLRAGTHILPHFGVSNIRTVMHLPLVTPPDCALNIVGYRSHQWREGELVMFDDTFQHEAWNRSAEDRLILLMDCWNPGLSTAEREAVAMLVEVVSGLQASNETGANGVGEA